MASIRYVDTASSGGDGTTRNHSGATAAYASLSSWEGNEGGDVAENYEVHCAGSTADTTATTISFGAHITTGSVKVFGDRSAPDNDGYYSGTSTISTGHYRLSAGNVANSLVLAEANMTVDGIQVENGDAVGSSVAVRVDTGPTTVKNCRIRNSSSCDVGLGTASAAGTTWTAENNLIVGFDTGGIRQQVANFFNPTFTAYHNTIYGDGSSVGFVISTGASNTPVFNIKGNAVGNTGDALSKTGATGTFNYDDNAFDTTESTSGEIALGTASDAWTSPATTQGSDFTVKNASSVLYNAVNPTLVTLDITGFTRDGANHDVGCFELQVAGQPTIKRWGGVSFSSVRGHQQGIRVW